MPQKRSENFDEGRSRKRKQYYIDHPEYRKKIAEHNQALGNDPEEREHRSERMKEVWKRPSRRLFPNAMQGKHHTIEARLAIGKSNKGKHAQDGLKNIGRTHEGNKDPRSEETRKKMREGWTPERRLAMSESKKVYWANLPENEKRQRIEKLQELIKGKPSKRKGIKLPREICKRMKENYWASDRAEKHSQRMKGSNNPRWKGGHSFDPYCGKFNGNFKLRSRALFNFTCVLCGTPENGHAHIVHHVNYDKKVCCNGKQPLFVLLCRSCHSKTNYNRQYWEDYFTQMVNEYYQGKTWLTDEEYHSLFPD